MDERGKTFRFLSYDEFSALTTQQRVDYLKEAMEARGSISLQTVVEKPDLLPSADEGDG